MSTFIIWTDLSHEEQEKKKKKFLSAASIGDKILYQGPNQLDQTWYIVIEEAGNKELSWIPSPWEDY